MILNRNPSSSHNYSVSSGIIAYEGDVDKTNKKDDALDLFEIKISKAVEAYDKPDNGASDPSGPEAGDLTEGNCLDDPISLMDRPESLSYYIQATQHNHRAFLTTNLCHGDSAFVTDLSSTWLMGRSRNCAIVVHNRSVSRCHAVVGYDVQQGFYLMDVGSSNGTYLNSKRLSVLKRYALVDGDMITLCNLQVEFFVAAQPAA
ncbi:MAG: FHA domain-containing protein [Alkalinema sp. CAN_BIN05]|nr:FHA domain-containing protein [Alkalinema sp. CAN_BIN05]